MNLKGALQSQYLASLAMLREAILKCPPTLWNAGGDKKQAWFKAYHAVYYAHKYLQPSSRDFVRWKGRGSTNGGAAISKDELLEYLRYVEEQVPDRLRRATFDAGSGFSSYPEADRLEMHLINIRHIQQHAGELYERLGDRGRVKLRWAGHIHRKAK
jgi:hypothetical protein